MQTWIAALLVRRGVLRHFRCFFTYTTFAVAAEIIKFLVRGSSRTYFHVYVVTQSIYAVLGFLAIYEVFNHVFRNFLRIRWFRFLLPGIGILMLAVSVLIAVFRPPIQASRYLAIIFVLEIGVRCLQIGMFFLIFGLAKFYNLYWRQYAFGIAAGFGVLAFGILLATVIRSEFGTRYINVITFMPFVTYFVAVLIWLASFFKPQPPSPFEDIGHPFTPELFVEQLDRYRQQIKDVLRPWFKSI